MIPTPPFASGSVQGYDFSTGKFNRFIFVGRPMIAFVNGGVPPYTWSITGAAFSLANASTRSQFNRIVTNSNTVVGESFEEVTVIDATGREVSFTISCCATYLCCDQQTIVFSVDDVEQMPVSDSVLKVYGGCPPFRWISLDSRASFLTEWTEVRQNILMYEDLSDVKGIQYKVIDHCGSEASGFVFELYPTYTFYFWGTNNSGQAFTGSNIPASYFSPNIVPDISGNPYVRFWVPEYSIAQRKDGSYWIAGENNYGQLALGDLVDRIIPVAMNMPYPEAEIVQVGNYVLGTMWILFDDGNIYTAGLNTGGRLGIGNSVSPQSSFVQIPGPWKWMSTSSAAVVATKTDGSVYGWGENTSRTLPFGFGISKDAPTLIPAVTNIVHVGWQGHGALYVDMTGQFYALGTNHGGGGSTYNSLTAYTPPFSTIGIKSIFSGLDGHLVIPSSGTLWVTGSNYDRSLGIGNVGGSSTFAQVGTDTDWEEGFGGNGVNFIRKTNGDWYVAGTNHSGQLGLGIADTLYKQTTFTSLGENFQYFNFGWRRRVIGGYSI